MLDLALGTTVGAGSTLFLVAPDSRRDDVQQQLRCPAFSRVSELGIRYLPYSQLQQHREAMARFGSGLAHAGDLAALALSDFGRRRRTPTLDLAIVEASE
jgi:type II restriction enzyme